VANIEIEKIPAKHYPDYITNVMFQGYKWDMQAGEQGTISDNVLILTKSEAELLAEAAVGLYNETIAMEQGIKSAPELAIEMGISNEMATALCGCAYNAKKHIRFMRFDFHPTTDGWQISEVNSDVPAGYPEASVLPKLAAEYFPGCKQYGSFGDIFQKQITKLIPANSTIAYLHDTHTVEDYQILHYLGDIMEGMGYHSIYGAPHHVKWAGNIAANCDAIVRYFPVEWMEFDKNTQHTWQNFVNSQTPSCNHPIALLTQSKRLPLIWDRLGLNIPMWKKYLPETKPPSNPENGWILKPAFGRVGEGINIPGTMSNEEEQDIINAAIQHPTQWVKQQLFESKQVNGLHVNIGVFVTDGEFAGFYARVSKSPRINEDASEIPILVKEQKYDR